MEHRHTLNLNAKFKNKTLIAFNYYHLTAHRYLKRKEKNLLSFIKFEMFFSLHYLNICQIQISIMQYLHRVYFKAILAPYFYYQVESSKTDYYVENRIEKKNLHK